MYGRLALRLLPMALLLALGVGCQVDLPLAGGRADPTEGLDLDGGADAAKRLAGDGAGGAEPAPGGAPAEDDPWGDPEEPLVGAEPLPRMEGVEPGVYATDRRWPAFARGWPGRVERALERLGVITGLEFAASGVPRVVLRPFGDETRTHELRAEILTGRRRSVVHVNIEPLLARVHDADRVLLRALAEAAFQDAGRRHGPVPPWFVRMAATVAAGDLEARLTALRRRALREGAEAVVVDPEDATTAEATGLAALVLLADRLGPADMRRAILFVADGDQAGSVLGRLVREADGSWQRPARLALGARLAAIDP
ncbi:MAG: hypothetical protein P1V36_16470, partial [Planctomycetota bacterium]|nr:hypothetical protein [Planctomycetota bacterium]